MPLLSNCGEVQAGERDRQGWTGVRDSHTLIQIKKEVYKKHAIMFGTKSSPEPEIMAQGVTNSAGLKPVLPFLKKKYLSLPKLDADD